MEHGSDYVFAGFLLLISFVAMIGGVYAWRVHKRQCDTESQKESCG